MDDQPPRPPKLSSEAVLDAVSALVQSYHAQHLATAEGFVTGANPGWGTPCIRMIGMVVVFFRGCNP